MAAKKIQPRQARSQRHTAVPRGEIKGYRCGQKRGSTYSVAGGHTGLCTAAVHSTHCALYTVHCTLYTVHCALYTVHCILYTVHPLSNCPAFSVDPNSKPVKTGWDQERVKPGNNYTVRPGKNYTVRPGKNHTVSPKPYLRQT